MAVSIPTQEPETITRGQTVKWTKSLNDFSASDGWILTYAFAPVDGGNPISWTASADGSNHLVEIAAETSLTFPTNDYFGQGYVEKDGERYIVYTGALTIGEYFGDYIGTGNAPDSRSKARKILNFIDDSFEKIVKKQVVRTTIEGVSLEFRSLKELMEARNYWAPQVAAEDQVATGGKRRCILAQFTKAI